MDNYSNLIKEELKKETTEMKSEVQKQTLGYVMAGLGLVAGLAWNEAIKAFIEYYFPLNRNNITAKFIYAILITCGVVVISYYLNRFFNKQNKK